MIKRAAALLAALAAILFVAPVAAQTTGSYVPGASYIGDFRGLFLPGGILAGLPTGLTTGSAIWTSSTDLSPATQFVNGFTGDLTLNATAPAGVTSAYNFGSVGSYKLSFPVTRPAYALSGGAWVAGTTSTTVSARSWLRQTYANDALPTEAANSGNAKIAVVYDDFVYANDTPGSATALSGLYVSGAVTSTAASGIPVTQTSTRAYSRPIGAWATPMGERIGSGQGFTVEFFGGHAYGQNGTPLAGVLITATDGTHSVSKSVTALTISSRQRSTSCTGTTNGSAIITGCGDTSWAIPGQRLTVPGIPGEPRLLSKTSSTLTFGSTQTCVTTLNSGNIKIQGTPVNGDGLADGAFLNATLTDANIIAPSGVATINSSSVTADVTTVSSKTTAIMIHTNATAVTAEGTGHTCTVNHVYQGTTGTTVTVTLGDPTPVYAGVFSSSDFSTFTDGLIWFRAQTYGPIGDRMLDTQTGADGTRCDWFFKNVNSGVCNSSSAAWFNINGTDLSPNLHNLSAYLDRTDNYKPAYVWVKPTGTCTTAACVSASAADPAGPVSAYAATPLQAQANLKLWYNTGGNVTTIHNDAMGGVICLTAGTYALSGNLATNTVSNKPPQTVTSAVAGGNCPATGTANNDVANVIINAGTTPSKGMRWNNVTLSGTGTIFSGPDSSQNTAFGTVYQVFNDNLIRPGAAPAIYQVALNQILNGLLDESLADGSYLYQFSTTTAANGLLLGTTTVCGTNVAQVAKTAIYTHLGVITFGCAPTDVSRGLETNPTGIQPISTVAGFSRYMGMQATAVFQKSKNLLLATDIFELLNTNASPALQISADNVNTPADNVVRSYNTVPGGRTNIQYLEGVPPLAVAVGSGGAFSAGTKYILISYALVGNPTVETSTDGVYTISSGVYTGTTVVLNGSMTLALPCDPNYVAYIYAGTSVSGTGPTATLSNYAKVGGVDAKQLAMCQTVVITDLGSAQTSPSVSSLTGHNEAKTAFFDRFNIDMNRNLKGDWYGLAAGASGSVGSSGRVGSFEGRYRTGMIGNVAVTGTVINSGYGSRSGLGELAGLNENYNSSNSKSDISWVKYKSDRSYGSGDVATNPTSPALNIGFGDYHIDLSVTNAQGVVPTGLRSWPTDIEGLARKNGATACAGAHEC